MDDVYLKVYLDRSELHENGLLLTFEEGAASEEAKRRYAEIKTSLENGYLTNTIDSLIAGSIPSSEQLSDEQMELIKRLVDSVTSEVGRALIGITILQLTVKAVVPEQSIMLHKGSSSSSSFSWKEGISMRSLDKYYITPILRRYELLRLNADGFMMTRSLAENYPYSKVYKAQLKGARVEWLEIVSQLEKGQLNSEEALKYMLSLLINRASGFTELANSVIQASEQISEPSFESVYEIISEHISSSGYKARLFEIAMHSYFQAMQDLRSLDGLDLLPLSQMRSANKKHGNIGDIELLDGQDIVVSWDAKYGKEYLRDEIEELHDKIMGRTTAITRLGFVVSGTPLIDDEIKSRIAEILELTGNQIDILTFAQWLNEYRGDVDSSQLGKAWLKAYVESLGQKRREVAPIDEPCNAWLTSLKDILLK
jgi:hypothetical protein